MTRAAILIADDREHDIIVLRRVFTPLDADLVCVSSGEAAVQEAQNKEFALVVLDVQMTGISGTEASKQIFESCAGPPPPIIFVSAEDHGPDIFLSYAGGGVDFLAKPVRPAVILAKARVFLRMYEQRQDLERSQAAMREFAFAAAHDLGGPFRRLAQFAQLAQSAMAAGNTERALGHISRLGAQAERGRTLVGGLLDFARATRDSELEDVELTPLLTDLLGDLHSDIEACEATIDLPELGTVQGNPAALHQIFLNLLTNALRYRRESVAPHVRIHAVARGDTLDVIVRDNGRGFEPAQAAKVFDAFTRLHNDKKVAGNGLGLATARSAAERMGGALTAAGAPGIGATFTLSLKRRIPAPTANPRVLLVDDDETTLKVFTQALSEQFEVVVATNAVQALELLETQSFELLVSDYWMPGHNGLWLLRQVEVSHPEIRRVLISGAEVPADVREHDAVDAFLAKPLTAPNLIEFVRQRLAV